MNTETTVETLRRAATSIRETAEKSYPGPTLGHLDESGPHIALWDPVTALCVADWLDAEATLLDLMEPLVDLWNAVLKQDDRPVGEFKLGRQENGEIAMHIESTPAALTLAHRILGSAS